MATKLRELTRYAVLRKDTGEVLKIKNMRHNYQPTLDADRYVAVKVGDDVEPGMIRSGERFAWPE